MTTPILLVIVITAAGAALFGAVTLAGAWIDGRRQKLLDRGLHPTTTPEGSVVARESEDPIRTANDKPAR